MNLEVRADLLKVSLGDGDVIGLHELPLEDGQWDVGAGGEVTLLHHRQGGGASRGGVAL